MSIILIRIFGIGVCVCVFFHNVYIVEYTFVLMMMSQDFDSWNCFSCNVMMKCVQMRFAVKYLDHESLVCSVGFRLQGLGFSWLKTSNGGNPLSNVFKVSQTDVCVDHGKTETQTEELVCMSGVLTESLNMAGLSSTLFTLLS